MFYNCREMTALTVTIIPNCHLVTTCLASHHWLQHIVLHVTTLDHTTPHHPTLFYMSGISPLFPPFSRTHLNKEGNWLTTPHCTALLCATPHCNALFCTTLLCSTSHWTTLICTTPHWTTLFCSTPHWYVKLHYSLHSDYPELCSTTYSTLEYTLITPHCGLLHCIQLYNTLWLHHIVLYYIILQCQIHHNVLYYIFSTTE